MLHKGHFYHICCVLQTKPHGINRLTTGPNGSQCKSKPQWLIMKQSCSDFDKWQNSWKRKEGTNLTTFWFDIFESDWSLHPNRYSWTSPKCNLFPVPLFISSKFYYNPMIWFEDVLLTIKETADKCQEYHKMMKMNITQITLWLFIKLWAGILQWKLFWAIFGWDRELQLKT